MDAHLIYTVANRLISHVTWQPTEDIGWLYCGLSDDLKTDLLDESINKHFQDQKIYLILYRKETCEIATVDAIATIASTIDKRDFSLWNLDFKKVMDFNKIGIFRIGTCTATPHLAQS
jgi:hypothetical protein